MNLTGDPDRVVAGVERANGADAADAAHAVAPELLAADAVRCDHTDAGDDDTFHWASRQRAKVSAAVPRSRKLRIFGTDGLPQQELPANRCQEKVKGGRTGAVATNGNRVPDPVRVGGGVKRRILRTPPARVTAFLAPLSHCTAGGWRYITITAGAARRLTPGAHTMSIVRVGMAENKKYTNGFDAIFSKKKAAAKKPAAAAPKPPAKKTAKKK